MKRMTVFLVLLSGSADHTAEFDQPVCFIDRHSREVCIHKPAVCSSDWDCELYDRRMGREHE